MPSSLRSIRFFRSCPDNELALLDAILSTRTLEENEVLFTRGEPADAFFLLVAGRLLRTSEDLDRRPEGPGEQLLEPERLCGVAAALGGARRSTVVAVTRSTVLVFPQAQLNAVLDRSPWLKRLLDEIFFKARHSDQILGWLRHTGVFRGLPPRELARVLSHMRLRQYPAGAAVIRQGERGASMGLIVRGEARMQLDLGRRKRVGIAALTEGDLYGETGLLADTIRETTVEAITPLSVLVLHRNDLLALADEAPYLMQAVSQVASDRYEDTLESRVRESTHGIAATVVGRLTGIGRTTLVAQLAASIEKDGLSVGIVDATAPWGRPALARALRIPVPQPTDASDVDPHSLREVGRWRSATLYHLERTEGVDPGRVVAHIAELKRRHDVVLIDAPALDDGGAASTDGLLEASEWIIHITRQPGVEALPSSAHRRAILHVVPDGGAGPTLPYIGRDIQRLPWDRDAARHFAHTGNPWVLSHPDAGSSLIVRRLKRALLRRQVGIALAGGGNWGFSHIGVLQVLEENRIAVDMVSGTSCGAFIGGLFSSGLSGREIEQLILKVLFPGSLKYLKPSFFLMGSGLFSGAGWERFTGDIFRGRTFTDLKYPFWPNAMDANTGEEIVFRHGPVFHGVTAAAALPGVFAPYPHNGRTLLDGGFVDNLPLGVLYEMGCNVSIGVNCIPHLGGPEGPPDIRQGAMGRLGRLQVRLSGMGDGRRGMPMRPVVAPVMAPLTAISTLNMMMRGIQMLCHRIGEETGRLADVYIAPQVGDAQWFEFHKLRGMINAGRRGAQEALDRILEVCPRDT